MNAPETHEILTLFKGLINVSAVTSILEPVSDTGKDNIFVPDSSVLLEGMDFDYWSRIVLLERLEGEGVKEDESGAIPFMVHCRVDISPPNSASYKVEKAMASIHRQILRAAKGKKVSPDKANVVMPFFRTYITNKPHKTKSGYYSTYAIYKTILSSYE